MNDPLHDRPEQAQSFGATAREYDRARPGYPSSLVDALLAGSPRRVLDVGTGTGLAARQVARRVPELLGLEPDPRMAEVARGHGLTVEQARIEDWDAGGRRFDLVMAAQSWHWVHPQAGTARAVSVLAPGGLLAVFWNLPRPSPGILAAMAPVYRRHAPELGGRTLLLGHDDGRVTRAAAVFRATPGLTDVRVAEHPSSRVYTPRQWVDHAATWSDHAALGDDRRAALLTGLYDALTGLGDSFTGDSFTMDVENPVVSARRAEG